jgi:hypothetical protein
VRTSTIGGPEIFVESCFVGPGFSPAVTVRLTTGFTGCGKTQSAVILSEAKNLSLFLFLYLNRREILRFAQNDKTRHFFRSLFSR